jgi:hypothetical protein
VKPITNEELKEEPFEFTTTSGMTKPLKTIDLANSLLTPDEVEDCKTLHFRIRIFDKVIFSGKESVYRIILQIADPHVISEGNIKADRVPYFNWSQAKVLIGKKYGLSDFHYNGTKNRIVGIIVSSRATQQEEHLHRFQRITKVITTKYPTILFAQGKCQITAACDRLLPHA